MRPPRRWPTERRRGQSDSRHEPVTRWGWECAQNLGQPTSGGGLYEEGRHGVLPPWPLSDSHARDQGVTCAHTDGRWRCAGGSCTVTACARLADAGVSFCRRRLQQTISWAARTGPGHSLALTTPSRSKGCRPVWRVSNTTAGCASPLRRRQCWSCHQSCARSRATAKAFVQ